MLTFYYLMLTLYYGRQARQLEMKGYAGPKIIPVLFFFFFIILKPRVE